MNKFTIILGIIFCLTLFLQYSQCESCSKIRNLFANNRDWDQLLRTEGKTLPTQPQKAIPIKEAPLNLRCSDGFVSSKTCKIPSVFNYGFG